MANRRKRDFLRRFGLLDLLDDLEVFDLGQALTAIHSIAEADGQLLQPSRGPRHNRDCRVANEVADDGDFSGKGSLVDLGQFHRQRAAPTAAAKASTAAEPTAAREAPAAAAATAAFTAALGCAAGLIAGHAEVIRGAGERYCGDGKDEHFFHEIETNTPSDQALVVAESAATAAATRVGAWRGAACRLDIRDAGAARRGDFLNALEIDLCPPVIEQGPQFGVLRVAQDRAVPARRRSW